MSLQKCNCFNVVWLGNCKFQGSRLSASRAQVVSKHFATSACEKFSRYPVPDVSSLPEDLQKTMEAYKDAAQVRYITVFILSFRTDMPELTVYTQIRRRRMRRLIRVDTVCHSPSNFILIHRRVINWTC